MQIRCTSRELSRPFCFVVIIFCLTGCSGDQKAPWETGATLEGSVTLDEKPFGYGDVVIRSQDGKKVAVGQIQKNGTYTVPNAPTGPVDIGVHVRLKIRKLQQNELVQHHIRKDPFLKEMEEAAKQGDEQIAQQLKEGKEKFAVYQELKGLKKAPATMYEKPETSGISTEIQSGVNKYDIKLTSQ